jgi:hypothetical protein
MMITPFYKRRVNLPAKRLSVSEERLCSIQLANKANYGGRAVYGMGLAEVFASG